MTNTFYLVVYRDWEDSEIFGVFRSQVEAAKALGERGYHAYKDNKDLWWRQGHHNLEIVKYKEGWQDD